MGAIRATVAAVLVLFTAVAANAECVTTARLIATGSSDPILLAGPVAWSGSVLGVAKTQEGVSAAIWFAVYDEDLQTVVGDRLVASDSREIVGLAWNGTEFGLFYRTNNQRLHLQRLTMMGDPIGGPIAITSNRTVYPSDEIDIEWSPVLDAYVVGRFITQGESKGIWVTYVGRDGTHRTDRRLPVFIASTSPLSVSVTDSGVVGLFYVSQAGSLTMARVATETSTPISNAISQTPGTFIQTAAQGGTFIVTHSVENGEKTEIRWLIVDTSHQILRPDGLLLEGSGDDAWPLALIATEDELALAYIDADNRDDPFDKLYRLRRFTLNGTTITDTNFAAAEFGAATRSESSYPFVWTGTSYLQAGFRRAPDRLNSHLMRYCPLRVSIETNVAYGRPSQPVVFTAVPEGGVPGYSYAWTFGDPTRVFRTQSVARTYEDVGTYTANLTVTDSSGARYTTTYTINIVNVKRRSARH